jgi:hypothetical protein
MSVKNLSQDDYNRFVKNNNVDIFSQEKIKNIPRHRLVMMNSGKGKQYFPFSLHGLHTHLKHSMTHPIIQTVVLNPETRMKIKEKYLASVVQDLKDVASQVSQANFTKALKKVNFSKQITNVLLKAHHNKNWTVQKHLIQNINPNKIAEVTRILLSGNNKRKNNRNVPNSSKAYANEQRRKHHHILLKQQRHQAEIELNKNKNALGRASDIAHKVLDELTRDPSKTEFEFPQLGFKMLRMDDMMMMKWYPPSKKRSRSGNVLFPPNSSSITIPIQKMVFTNFGYLERDRVSGGVNVMGTAWLVPDILDTVPGSRATVQQMSKALLLLLKKKVITSTNLRTGNNNNTSYARRANTDDGIISLFHTAGIYALSCVFSSNTTVIANVIRLFVKYLRDHDNDELSHIHINFIDVGLSSSDKNIVLTIDKSVDNNNGLSYTIYNIYNSFRNIRNWSQVTSIRILGDFIYLHDNNTYQFDIVIKPDIHVPDVSVNIYNAENMMYHM